MKWEYLVKDSRLISDINKIGEIGWELVSAVPHQANGHTTHYLYYFKRQKP